MPARTVCCVLSREISKCVKRRSTGVASGISTSRIMTTMSTCSRTGSRGKDLPSSLRPTGRQALRWRHRATRPHSDGPHSARHRRRRGNQAIKADPITKHIPVIALTASAMAGDREEALAAGGADFDRKPVELPRLLARSVRWRWPGVPGEPLRRRAARCRRHRDNCQGVQEPQSHILRRGDETAWLTMQSESKRSRGRFSLQFAICREFQKLQGE